MSGGSGPGLPPTFVIISDHWWLAGPGRRLVPGVGGLSPGGGGGWPGKGAGSTG